MLSFIQCLNQHFHLTEIFTMKKNFAISFFILNIYSFVSSTNGFNSKVIRSNRNGLTKKNPLFSVGKGGSGGIGGNGGGNIVGKGSSAIGDSEDGSKKNFVFGAAFSAAFAEKTKNKAKEGLSILKIPGLNGKLTVEWYVSMLEKHPLMTKAITASVIAGAGDFLAQYIAHKIHIRTNGIESVVKPLFRHDTRRGFACMCDGLLISGPLMHLFYDFMERILPISSGGSFAAIVHVLADSVLLDSIFVATAMTMTGLLEGFSFSSEIIPQFKSDYVPALTASWTTSTALIPIEFLCFRYLPLSLRTLSMNFTSVIWDGVIYFMAHRSR